MSAHPARVLLVDDDDGLRQACAEALQQSGYQVTTAANGTEGLQRFAHQPFEAAVLDLVLPDMDGLTILSALREADPDVLLILMTGHATLEAAIEAVRRGAYDFLRKPFSALDLTRVVARGLEQRQLAVRNRELVAQLDTMNQELRHRVEVVTDELTAFLDLGRKLSTADGPLPLLGEILRASMQLTTARTAAVGRRVSGGSAAAGGEFRFVAAEGEAAGELAGMSLTADEPLVARCLRTGKPAIVPELLADPETVTGPFALLGLASALAVPLQSVAGPVGAMLLFDPAQPFTDRQASLMKVLVAQAGEVMAQAALLGPARTPEAASDEFVDLQDLLAARRGF
jgi:DNA-binding response OmpR family regulator